MRHGSLFSGIGGAELAASWMGWENVFHCEINKYCQKLLKQHFPESIGHGDIKTADFRVYRGQIDVLTGGFPCQPFSQSGKRQGSADERHLWPQYTRAINEIQPRWIVGENVSGLLNWSRGLVLQEIKNDLAAEGYKMLPSFVCPAGAVGADHLRDRVWIIAHADSERFKGKHSKFGDEIRTVEKSVKALAFSKINNIKDKDSLSESFVVGTNDGVPNLLDRIKGLGNAWVPQVAYQIFKAIQQYEDLNQIV